MLPRVHHLYKRDGVDEMPRVYINDGRDLIQQLYRKYEGTHVTRQIRMEPSSTDGNINRHLRSRLLRGIWIYDDTLIFLDHEMYKCQERTIKLLERK